ncbi:MAG: polysaccharide deacetylase family protein [Lachnospiraceae bacterium]|nr:polysaccharide deacetylase family protein [Lachnospiraceae bacterium]
MAKSGKRRKKLTEEQRERIRHIKRVEKATLTLVTIVLLGSLGAVLYFALFRNPAKPAGTPAATPTPVATSTPSATPTPTLSPTPSPTPLPTATPTPSPIPGPTVGPGTPTPTPVDNRLLIAFTFDDGPHSGLTPLFVEKLKEYNGKATWFVVGNRINEKTGPQLREAAEAGMEIEIHAWTHSKYFDKVSDAEYHEEVDKTFDKIMEYTGVPPKMLRAPGGRITKARIAESPLYVINWSVDSEDWKLKGRSTEEERQNNVNQIVSNVMNQSGRGRIVLMHEIYENSYEAFCILLEKLSSMGYEFVTVSELLGEAPLGVQYYKRP